MRISDFGHASGGRRHGLGPSVAGNDSARLQDPTGPGPGELLAGAATDQVVPSVRHDRTSYSWLGRPADLVVLTASAPVLVGALLAAGVPRDTGFQIVAGWTDSLNVAATLPLVATPVADGAGDCAVTVGGAVSAADCLKTTSTQ